jgi:hypothetical protein
MILSRVSPEQHASECDRGQELPRDGAVNDIQAVIF